MPQRSFVIHTIGFAAAVCVVCAVLVSSSAVLLRDRQRDNVELDRKRNVLMAAGVIDGARGASRQEVEQQFASFEMVAIDLRTGDEDPAFVAAGYDPRRALADANASRPAPPNDAQLARIPNHALAYRQRDASGRLQLLVLPVEGMGLWGTMYGFVALGPDLKTVRGLTYYEHKETPGLGAEVDNPKWRALWPGRVAFDEEGTPVIEVLRGRAGPFAEDPHRVDGIAGATITGRGVTAMLRFWLGAHGYGPFLKRLPQGGTDG